MRGIFCYRPLVAARIGLQEVLISLGVKKDIPVLPDKENHGGPTEARE